MVLRKYLAELIGTFFLAFAVGCAITQNFPLAVPVVAGLTLGLFVYTVGAVSGAHLNPAVTIAMASVKKINPKDAAFYVVAQLIGGFLAMYALKSWEIFPTLDVIDDFNIALSEAMGAFVLAFGVSAVVNGKVGGDSARGLVVGGSLTLGAMLASIVSNGVINPAVAIGIGSISVIYLLSPIVGAVIAAWVYKMLWAK